MKKILYFFILVMAIFMLIFVLNKNLVVRTFKNTNYISMEPRDISKNILKDYFSNDITKRNRAINKIKEITLKNIDYKNWFDYIETIELKIYEKNINNKELLFIVLNLSKDSSVISIYEKEDGNYIYINKIENVVNIKDLVVYNTPTRAFILVFEYVDERLGAFFYDNYIRIFTTIENTFSEVLRQSIEYEALIKSNWLNDNNDNLWYKVNENALFKTKSDESNNFYIDFSVILKKYISKALNDEVPDDFKLVEDKNVNINYKWNESFKYFLQGFAKLKSNNEIVGIILDSNQTVESLLTDSKRYFKIIDKNGKIRYVPKEELFLINYTQ